MHEPIYEKLTEALNMRGGGLLAIKCPEFYDILRELFTPEEASLASQMPMDPVPAADLAAEIGRDPGEVERMLEEMANKGLVSSEERGEVTHYSLLQMLPGMVEMQFVKGEVNERAKRLALLFVNYFTVMAEEMQKSGAVAQLPWARVIAVEAEIPAGVEIQPYDRVSHYIENTEYIAVFTCTCRHLGELLGGPCDKPKDVCMGFGDGAKFLAQRGFGRLVSKEEARQILDLAEREGLVHCSSNTSKQIEFICNCCGCHCGVLQSIKNAAMPSMGATSGFIMMVDQEKCMGCGDCIDRCPMEALSMEDDIVAQDDERCIGCGLCISVCPTEALRMEPRPERPLPLPDRESLTAALRASLKTDSPSS